MQLHLLLIPLRLCNLHYESMFFGPAQEP